MTLRTLATPLLVAALVLVSGTALAAVTGSPDISASFSDNTVAPGAETTVEVVLVNSGTIDSGSTSAALNSEVTTARGLTVRMNDGNAPISVQTNKQAVGSFPEGTTAVPFKISVDDDAKPGSYEVPVRIEYEHTDYVSTKDGTRDEKSVERTLRLTLRVSEQATFDVVDVQSSARVNSTGPVQVTVNNTGEEVARDAAVTIQSNSQDLSIGGAQTGTRFVDEWQPGEQRTFTYRIDAAESAQAGAYGVGLSVNFDDADGVRTNSTATTLGIPVFPEQSFSLGNVTTTLQAGEEGRLGATVTNTGDRAVENVVLTWESEHSNISPQETQYAVGDLGPGESKQVDFGVDVSENADAGPRQFDFVATYRAPDGDRASSDVMEARAEVAGSTDEFSVTTTNTTVDAGQDTTIELTVTNEKDERLTDISAKLFADSPISVTDDEAYVSGLDPGESATIKFGVTASGDALAKDYPVSVDFQYEEPDGDTPISDTYRVPITVTEPSGDGLPLSAIAGIALVAVIAIGGYVRFR